MSQPFIQLDKALQKGVIRHLKLTVGSTNTDHPAAGKKWLLLYGTINHVTGTETNVYIAEFSGTAFNIVHGVRTKIPAATATGIVNMFQTTAAVDSPSELHPAYTLPFMGENDYLVMTGGAGGYCYFTVLEW